MNYNYPAGNYELMGLFEKQYFDRDRAEAIITKIKNLNTTILDAYGHPTTYLFKAQEDNNVEAVELLFKYGADPNYISDENDYALWELQYCFDAYDYEEHVEEIIAKRTEIIKLFFKYGANPLTEYDHETLYDYIRYKFFNDCSEHDEEIVLLLYMLSSLYAASDNKRIFVDGIIDVNTIDDYHLKLTECEDGYHIRGEIYGPNGFHIDL